MKKIITMAIGTMLLFVLAGCKDPKQAKKEADNSTVASQTLKCQTVISAKADEVVMLKDFTDTVTELTGGSLKFEIMPAGAVVGVNETLDAVDKGLIDCGFAWTHYWSGDHPAAMLFG